MAQEVSSSAEVSRVVEPEHLLCPITRVLFLDPVLTTSGKVYERAALVQHWDGKGIPHDPLTNAVLSDSTLNIAVAERNAVAAFLQGNPSYLPDGWSTRQVPDANEIQWVPQAASPTADTLDIAYQRHFFQPLLDGSIPRLVQVRTAHRALVVLSVAWLCWAAIFIGVLSPFQSPSRSKDNLQEEQGEHIFYLAAWSVRALFMVVGLFHLLLTYRLARKAKELIKESNALSLPPVSSAVLRFAAYSVIETMIFFVLLVLLYEGLFRYNSMDDSGYEVNTNTGGPVSCLHDPRDIGYNDKHSCENAFMARFKMLIGGLCVLNLFSTAVGSYSFYICWIILRVQTESVVSGTSPVALGRPDSGDGNAVDDGLPNKTDDEDGLANI